MRTVTIFRPRLCSAGERGSRLHTNLVSTYGPYAQFSSYQPPETALAALISPSARPRARAIAIKAFSYIEREARGSGGAIKQIRPRIDLDSGPDSVLRKSKGLYIL